MITTERNEYVAAHVTKYVKDVLAVEAKKQGISRSLFIANAIEDKLKALGASVEPAVFLKEEDVRLPLEG